MKTSSNNKEKPKHPRTMVSLPLHFRANENGGVYPELTADATEPGILIQTLGEIPVQVLFPKKLNLVNFKAESGDCLKKYL